MYRLAIYMPIYSDTRLLSYSLPVFQKLGSDVTTIFVIDRVNGYTEEVIRRYVKHPLIVKTYVEPGQHGWGNHMNYLIRRADHLFENHSHILFTQADVILDLDTILENYMKHDLIAYTQRLGLRWDLPRKIHSLLAGGLWSGVYSISYDLYMATRPTRDDEKPYEDILSENHRYIVVKTRSRNIRPYPPYSLYNLGRYRRRIGWPLWKQLLWSLGYFEYTSLRGYLDEWRKKPRMAEAAVA